MSTATITAPFAVGDRVRLDRPDDPNHPRRGRTGTVFKTRYWPEEIAGGRVAFNSVWMAWVRFDPAAAPDQFDRLGVGSDWVCIEGEISRVDGGSRP